MSFDTMAAQDDEREAVVAYLQKRRLALKTEYEVLVSQVETGLVNAKLDDLRSQIDLLKELSTEIGHCKHHKRTP